MGRREKRAAASAGRLDSGRLGKPDSEARMLQTALIDHRTGRLRDAKRIYAEILSRQPKNPDALHLLGVVKAQEGDVSEAAELIGKAIAIKPDFAEAHNNLGKALKDQGRLEEAVAAYREALMLRPDYAAAHNNLGNALKDQGRLDAAVAAYREALILKPDYAEALNNLGNALRGQGNLDAAVAAHREALKVKPDHALAHNNLGMALMGLGRLEESVAAFREGLKLNPDDAAGHNNLGIALKDQGKLEAAVASYREALRLRPGHSLALNNLGIALTSLGRLGEAVAIFDKALKVKPDLAEAHSNLGVALKDQGRLDEAVAAFHEARKLQPDLPEAHSSLVFGMNYDGKYSQKDIFTESRHWDEVHAALPSGKESPHPNDRGPDRRLRIAYVSPDFREHPVSYFLDPLIAGHDRRSVEVFCYAEVVKPDKTTARFRELADAWRWTVGVRDEALAERIREDAIDILVDLAGHTSKNRLTMFAKRPAPVQVTWLGYPNTTGLSAMDYRLTDAVADPEGAADALHSETLVRLPRGFICYAAPSNAPNSSPPPALANGHVTFGSFNNQAKVTAEVVETWARILHRVPRSHLLMKSGSLGDEETRRRYLEMFVAQGIDAGRIELCSWIVAKSGHLGAYGRVDIGLDSFPYNGTTTTCEALWMGVPVVTLRGARHSGRVGASILTRIALTECVAETKAEYVEKAVRLANDLDRLSASRKDLRNRMRGSPLCNSTTFARDVEAAYREMWRRWCSGDRGLAGAAEVL